MGCPNEVFVGEGLVFSITTHDPDTGVLTNADAVPAYKIFDDESNTPMDDVGSFLGEGTMPQIGSEIGSYKKKIVCSAANGFVKGNTYSIRVTASVGGDVGGVLFAFKAKDPIATEIQTAEILSGVNLQKAINHILAYASGSVTRTGSLYEYNDFNGDPLFNLVSSVVGITDVRERSVP